ncbi:hypothetical protein E2C01_009181 [Portunus trituberculatus]|uniref:Uncharacterized protein n=1 Tax=Portunus trituberculatus TaxID=210409 RepID=A0A5B7D473_PORTR|nr:hypothetical protein [Portunus trituberculatus]
MLLPPPQRPYNNNKKISSFIRNISYLFCVEEVVDTYQNDDSLLARSRSTSSGPVLVWRSPYNLTSYIFNPSSRSPKTEVPLAFCLCQLGVCLLLPAHTLSAGANGQGSSCLIPRLLESASGRGSEGCGEQSEVLPLAPAASRLSGCVANMEDSPGLAVVVVLESVQHYSGFLVVASMRQGKLDGHQLSSADDSCSICLATVRLGIPSHGHEGMLLQLHSGPVCLLHGREGTVVC